MGEKGMLSVHLLCTDHDRRIYEICTEGSLRSRKTRARQALDLSQRERPFRQALQDHLSRAALDYAPATTT